MEVTCAVCCVSYLCFFISFFLHFLIHAHHATTAHALLLLHACMPPACHLHHYAFPFPPCHHCHHPACLPLPHTHASPSLFSVSSNSSLKFHFIQFHFSFFIPSMCLYLLPTCHGTVGLVWGFGDLMHSLPQPWPSLFALPILPCHACMAVVELDSPIPSPPHSFPFLPSPPLFPHILWPKRHLPQSSPPL